MVHFRDIEAAALRIAPLAKRTPVLTSRLLDEIAGCQCFFKCENLQTTGSFKIRGAANFLLSIPKGDLNRGVVAFSSGNHAQAVARAATLVGTKATIVMPTDAPASKVAATRAYGASIVTYDRFLEDREAIGRDIAARTGATLVPPFDHEWIIAGQGTAALELLDQAAELDAVAVCVGGGGLLAGTATAVRGLQPRVRVFGAEPEQANDMFLSFRKGERVEIPPPDTIADGLRPTKPGAITFPIIQQLVEDVVLISEDEIRESQALVMSRLKVVIEPSGAVSAAAGLFRKVPGDVRRLGIIFSGGNV